jgi:hypothetical protein
MLTKLSMLKNLEEVNFLYLTFKFSSGDAVVPEVSLEFRDLPSLKKINFVRCSVLIQERVYRATVNLKLINLTGLKSLSIIQNNVVRNHISNIPALE